MLPDPTSRRKVFHYIQGSRVNKKLEFDLSSEPLTKKNLTKQELQVAHYLRLTLDGMYEEVSKLDPNIIKSYRHNYLPLLWTQFEGKNPLMFAQQFDEKSNRNIRCI